MKELIITIRPNKYYEVKDALLEAGFTSMSVRDVTGRGAQSVSLTAVTGMSGSTEETYEHPMLAKKMIEMIVRDEDCVRVEELIMKHARTGQPGDGKIFVLPVEEVTRIRTGETGIEGIM